jgi:hypothetical protein
MGVSEMDSSKSAEGRCCNIDFLRQAETGYGPALGRVRIAWPTLAANRLV